MSRYWCADQMMVQKALAAKSLSDAQGATILTGWIKTVPMFLIIIPGMMSRVLYPDTVSYYHEFFLCVHVVYFHGHCLFS